MHAVYLIASKIVLYIANFLYNTHMTPQLNSESLAKYSYHSNIVPSWCPGKFKMVILVM